ncbi:GMC oxidoreductase [Sphingobium algorifonticola]|uniref:GMC family oxidoreductase n=1 Tax=Sphingobium algorifonticola TaxID=2008318 RepID=A0A437J436_9SPHN|nr:GMC family oxidoreductase [Sphingobium algorifonticola]RVT39424.1 GMC family oxidoreductase [Sphingobium algorifonticola]
MTLNLPASDQRFDAIVIGSGISGGWAAKELTEKGLRVLLLDRGHVVAHGEYPTEGKAPFELPFRGDTPPQELLRDHAVNQANEESKHFFNNDRLNPYAREDGQPFDWIRPAAFGGRSLVWGRQSFRWSRFDFNANAADGHGVPWPIGYDDLAPWYDHVEIFAGIAGSAENLPELPDSRFLPPHKMNVAELWFKQQVETRMQGRRVIHGRASNITVDRPDQNRTKCQNRRQCHRGCSFGAYFSTQAVTLPAAEATGRLTVLADRVVQSLVYDETAKRVTGVRIVDTQSGTAETLTARIVFLCASAMASVQILMHSRLSNGETSFANESGMLGRGVMDHPTKARVTGTPPGLDDFIVYGQPPTGFVVPRFRNLGEQDPDADFVRGYFYHGIARRMPSLAPGFGAEMKHAMRRYDPWRVHLLTFAECLPYSDNRVTLHPEKVDRFGVPQLVFNVAYRDNEQKLLQDSMVQARRMMEAAGLQDIQTSYSEPTPGSAIHEMGGAPMGTDPRTSVLNRWSQAHAASNLFVTDGAQMNSSSCVNPSLTYMALTARAADHAARQIREGAL